MVKGTNYDVLMKKNLADLLESMNTNLMERQEEEYSSHRVCIMDALNVNSPLYCHEFKSCFDCICNYLHSESKGRI